MSKTLKQFLTSKKAVAMIVGVVMTILSKVTWAEGLSEEVVTGIIAGFIGIYIHAQGQADKGKEAEKVKVSEAAEKQNGI